MEPEIESARTSAEPSAKRRRAVRFVAEHQSERERKAATERLRLNTGAWHRTVEHRTIKQVNCRISSQGSEARPAPGLGPPGDAATER